MAKICVEYRTNLIELPRGGSVIGRDVCCRVRFNDHSVSRQHVRIDVADDGVRVEDLGSRNGTKLNGKALEAHARDAIVERDASDRRPSPSPCRR